MVDNIVCKCQVDYIANCYQIMYQQIFGYITPGANTQYKLVENFFQNLTFKHKLFLYMRLGKKTNGTLVDFSLVQKMIIDWLMIRSSLEGLWNEVYII